jgi:hypothetical protein
MIAGFFTELLAAGAVQAAKRRTAAVLSEKRASAESLSRGQEKRTMRKPEFQIGNSGWNLCATECQLASPP